MAPSSQEGKPPENPSGSIWPQDGCLRLTKDLAFTSPSPASALVKGRSSTGHGDWIRTTDRKRLGEVLLEPREQAEKAG